MGKRTSSDKRHGKLASNNQGRFGRYDVAIHGFRCPQLNEWITKLIAEFADNFVHYVDEDHQPLDDISMALTRHINPKSFSRTTSKDFFDSFENQRYPIAFLNGNHLDADIQILYWDASRSAKILNRLEKYSNLAVLLVNEGEELPTEIKALTTPENIIEIGDLEGCRNALINNLPMPSLNALLLAGGKSERMGKDKTQLKFHDKPQINHLHDLLTPLVDNVYVSCRSDQEWDNTEDFKFLPDRMLDVGPMGGIITAFMHDPNTAWLVIPCDIPGLDSSYISKIIESRDFLKTATTVVYEPKRLPEPLLSIWEPSSYSRLLSAIQSGRSCPRKVLINSKTKDVVMEPLMNVNTPEELEEYLRMS